jgi:PAS domain S-box-containing protein
MDALTLLVWVAFYALFFVSIRRYLVQRSPVNRLVMLVFSSTAALFLLSAINLLFPPISPYLGPVLIAILAAQPALMLWLAAQVVRLERWALPVAWLGAVAVVVAYYATNRSVAAVLLFTAYFGVTEFIAASIFIREGRRRHGLPRIRLALAGCGSILFGLSILVSGASSAARGGATADPAFTALLRSLALFAGISYLGAFAPPRWVLRLAHRALAFDLIRSIVGSPSGSQPQVLWRALAATVAQILGTPQVEVYNDERVLAAGPISFDGRVANVFGGHDVPGDDRRLTESAQGGSVVPGSLPDLEVPLVVDGRWVASVKATFANRALFLEDDIALIQTLGSLTARAVEREQALVGLAEANRAVAEAEAVRASEGRFRALLEADPNAVLAVDDGGVIRWATRSADRMFRLQEGQLIGRPLTEVIPHALPTPAPERGRPEPLRFETSALRGDGDPFPAEIAVTQFEFDAQPFRLVVVGDVTWRHEANAVRERFIGVLSHELRTPITSIFGGTQVLLGRAGRLDAATQAELLTDIAGEAERLQRMIENLLVLARVEGGAEVAEAGPVLLHRVLPDVVAREQAMWPEMRITATLPPSLPLVAADEASLSLVVRNLISNAGKYAGAGATVDVVASTEPNGEVCIRVLDNGPGVDQEESDRLFELYFRSKGTHAVPGSGIGLFVCRQLVSAMGGRTWARSRAEGGAEFGFTLPVYEDADDAIAAMPAPQAGGRQAAAAIAQH